MTIFESLANEPVQLLIPVIAAIIGWATNVMAIKMMFYPLEFVGIKSLKLGWQGIVPSNALRLANTGLKLVTSKLLKVPELFDDFDSDEFVGTHGTQITDAVRRVIETKAAELFPQMWNTLPPPMKEQVFQMAEAEVKKISADVMDDAAENVEKLLDVEQVVTDAVLRDKALMNRTFLTVGSAEFKFIERSGLYFGFAFGLIQLLVWLLYPAEWVLPVFGFFVGYATNWLALKLIFEPREPKKVLGFTVQGLFHKRQKAIAREFADMVSRQVFNAENLFAEFTKESSKKELIAMVRTRAEALLDKYQNHPMAAMMATAGTGQAGLVEQIEADLIKEVEQEMFRPDGMIFAFTNKSEEIRERLLERMSVMDPEGFEDVLRPAFKQDEWKLILAGAVLGFGAGVLQLVALFADMT